MIKRAIRGFVYSSWVIVIGCASVEAPPQQSVPAPSESGRVIQELSQDWANFVVDDKYLVENNVWNRQAAIGPYAQSIFLKDIDGQKVFGWRWKGKSNGHVLAYPEVIYGPKPWSPASTRKSEFPFVAGDKNIKIDFDVAIKASGIYNMAFSIWTVNSLPPRKESINGEIMIWNHNHGMAPHGRHEGTIDVGGIKYDLYVREGHGDDSGANSNKWTYMSFIAQKSLFSGSLTVKPFVDFLLSKKLLTKKDYLANLELGNEVIEGEGVVEIRKFSVGTH
jgi:hypothetical protein